MNIFLKKIKYSLGTIYRGLIGIYHNQFDPAPKINPEIEWQAIGNTVSGKKIKCFRVGTGPHKVLIVAGIHGNEVGTVKLAQHILNWFWMNQKHHNNFLSLKLIVIPVLNLDGYYRALARPDYWHRGKVGRFNDHNVDLNRNFPTANFQSKSEWRLGKDYKDEIYEVFCGDQGGSEPETQSLINLIHQEDVTNLIMLHNVAGEVNVDKNDSVVNQWAEIYKRFAKFKIINRIDSGDVLVWCRENSIHFMNIEGSTRWGSDWSRQHQAIQKVFQVINQQ